MDNKPVRLGPPRPRQLIDRILDEPELVAAVQRLEPRAFGRLIDHVGLADAGELVALATTEQLERIFDEDLWSSRRAGEDETFDAQRFALWLQVMLEVGEQFAARKLAELDEELVTLALQRQVLVIDLDALAAQMTHAQDRRLEKALDSTLNLEIDQYRVIALAHDGWDTLAAVLLALDESQPDFLRRLLERCCHAGAEIIDDNGGLYEVLTAAEMIESDAAGAREERRARQGFVAPTQATAFLRLARTSSLADLVQATQADPITRAYFREYEAPLVTSNVHNQEADEARSRPLLDLLAEAEVLPERAPLLLDGAQPAEARYRLALTRLAPEQHGARMAELSYLANLLVAGGTHRGQRFRLVDAAAAVLAACNLGAETLAGARHAGVDAVAAEPADKLFRVGVHRLHHEVRVPALEQLRKTTRDEAEQEQAAELAEEQARELAEEQVRALAEDVPALLDGETRHFVANQAMIDEARRRLADLL